MDDVDFFEEDIIETDNKVDDIENAKTEIELNYFEVDALNHSLLKQFKYSPAHYIYAKNNPSASTAAMEFGTLVHELLLENVEENIIINSPLDKRTKVYKEWFKSIDKSKKIVEAKDLEIARTMIRHLTNKTTWQKLNINTVANEQEYYYKKDGYECKAKLDKLLKNGIVDIKTVASLEEGNFFNSIVKFDYHTQAAWYLEASAKFGYDINMPYYIIAMSKTAPYDSIIYELPRELIEIGHKLNNKRFEIFKYCTDTQNFYGYEDKVQTIKIPNWYMNSIVEEIA